MQPELRPGCCPLVNGRRYPKYLHLSHWTSKQQGNEMILQRAEEVGPEALSAFQQLCWEEHRSLSLQGSCSGQLPYFSSTVPWEINTVWVMLSQVETNTQRRYLP